MIVGLGVSDGWAGAAGCQFPDLLRSCAVVEDEQGAVVGGVGAYPPAELASGCSSRFPYFGQLAEVGDGFAVEHELSVEAVVFRLETGAHHRPHLVDELGQAAFGQFVLAARHTGHLPKRALVRSPLRVGGAAWRRWSTASTGEGRCPEVVRKRCDLRKQAAMSEGKTDMPVVPWWW
ncbi:hypothetical protein ACIBG8_42830 [Nonomuraea sp. NPDC050556]|uniref:hypothetical protein n=1 Tax=Nonomuraea sp. NPDC050556 TaxID=3364369 RepID=UPI0037A1836A